MYAEGFMRNRNRIIVYMAFVLAGIFSFLFAAESVLVTETYVFRNIEEMNYAMVMDFMDQNGGLEDPKWQTLPADANDHFDLNSLVIDGSHAIEIDRDLHLITVTAKANIGSYKKAKIMAEVLVPDNYVYDEMRKLLAPESFAQYDIFLNKILSSRTLPAITSFFSKLNVTLDKESLSGFFIIRKEHPVLVMLKGFPPSEYSFYITATPADSACDKSVIEDYKKGFASVFLPLGLRMEKDPEKAMVTASVLLQAPFKQDAAFLIKDFSSWRINTVARALRKNETLVDMPISVPAIAKGDKEAKSQCAQKAGSDLAQKIVDEIIKRDFEIR